MPIMTTTEGHDIVYAYNKANKLCAYQLTLKEVDLDRDRKLLSEIVTDRDKREEPIERIWWLNGPFAAKLKVTDETLYVEPTQAQIDEIATTTPALSW